MGWKQSFRITSRDFKSYFDRGQKWGELDTFEVTIGGTKYYGAGLVGSPAEGQVIFRLSPKIAHVPGTSTRINVKFIHYADANTPIGCAAGIFIVFYTNGDTAKNERGNDIFGVELMLVESPPVNAAEFHEFRVEQSGNKIVWYLNNKKINETVLSGTLQSFRLGIILIRYRLASEATSVAEQTAQTPTPGDPYGIVIYEITAEYYDWLEDVFSSITQVMIVMMFAMVGVTLITTLFRAFRVRE